MRTTSSPGELTPVELGNWLHSAQELPDYVPDERLVEILCREEERRQRLKTVLEDRPNAV